MYLIWYSRTCFPWYASFQTFIIGWSIQHFHLHDRSWRWWIPKVPRCRGNQCIWSGIFIRANVGKEKVLIDNAIHIESNLSHEPYPFRYHEMFFMIDTCQANTMYSKIYSPNILATGSSMLGESSYSVSITWLYLKYIWILIVGLS